MTSSLFRCIGSSRLAIGLLISLALLAAVGTFSQGELPKTADVAVTEGFLRFIGIRNTFAGVPFLSVVTLLVVNILVCTVQRFRVFERKSLFRILDLLMHLALVVMVAGAVLRVVVGSIGTLSIREGEGTSEIYDWGSRRHVPLGYTLRVDSMVFEHFPMLIRLGVREAGAEKKVALLEILEGSERVVEEKNIGVRFLEANRGAGRVTVLIRSNSGTENASLDLGGGPDATVEHGGYSFALVAYRDEIRTVKAKISAKSAEVGAVEQWISPNQKVRVGRASVFLTAWQKDPFGSYSAGLQVTSDPAAPLFWAGCLVFLSALVGRIALKVRGRVRSS